MFNTKYVSHIPERSERAYTISSDVVVVAEWFYKMFTSNLNYIKVMKEKLNAKEL